MNRANKAAPPRPDTDILVRQATHPGIRDNWRRYSLSIAVIFALGLGAAAGVLTLADTLRDLEAERFSADATNQFDTLANNLKADRLDATSIADSYGIAIGQDRAHRAEYQPRLKLLYDNIHRRAIDLELAGVILRVADADRPAFEAAQTAELGRPYRITTMDRAGRMPPAAPRPVYYPLVFVEPPDPGDRHFGMDMGFEGSAMIALSWADQRDLTNISRPLDLRFTNQLIKGYLVVAPIRTKDAAGQTRLLGYAVEFNSLDKLLAATTVPNDNVGTVALFDSGAAQPERPIVVRGQTLAASATLARLKRSKLNLYEQVDLGDHTWTVVFVPATAASSNTMVINIAVAANAVFIMLIAVYLLSSTSKRLAMESVEAALRDSYKDLSASHRTANRRTGQLTLLSEMSNMLQACDTLAEVLLVSGLFVPKLFERESGAMYLLDAEQRQAESRMAWGERAPSTKVFAFDECFALRKGGVYQITDVENDLICQHLGEPKPASYLCVPMMAQGRALGLFYVTKGALATRRSGGADQISHAGYELATTIAEHLAMALANVDLRDRLKTQSITDPLTGLYNRRYMEDMLEREIKRADRAGTAVGLVMFDIDFFKKVNDTFGHEAGDRVLETLGVFLKTNVRAEDIACRYGGEEFLIILPGSNRANTFKRADDIRRKAELLAIEASGVSLGTITLSGGVAVYPEDGDRRETVLARADKALYRAKDAGRNRIE